MEEINVGLTLLWIAAILFAARCTLLIERWGQPPVLGELLAGVVLGNLGLLGIHVFEPILNSPVMVFLAELGVVILLFQVGLESHIREMSRVGLRALLVACVGVIIPFVLGTYVAGPLLLPGLSNHAYLFLGATLTATSVGITARVFQDLKILRSPEAQIVLGAAVIDDVLGLIILAVVSEIVTAGELALTDIGVITLKAVAFLIGAIVIGQTIAPWLGRGLSMIHTGKGMKLTLALCFGFICAYLAQRIGLAPIVGAFAAGLVLDPVHFRHFKDPEIVDELRAELDEVNGAAKQRLSTVIDHHALRHVDEIVEPIGNFLVPIFFVLTGMSVHLEALFNPKVLLVALGITLVAFVGKAIAGLVAGPVNKTLVGWGMVPRGEVGLIFAATGQRLGIVTPEVFGVIVIVVILSTLLTPPILTYIVRRQHKTTGSVDGAPAVAA
ncbi:MAG: cation:proton antiporter [Caldilineaceae bacterium]|nr:cation:proton antiporter [Caldilineaceae bacterium]